MLLGALVLALPFLGLALLLTTEQRLLPINPINKDGLLGLALAGSGVYAYTIGLLILRIWAGTLSTGFLLTTAIRSFLLMMMGYALGLMGVFQLRKGILAPFLYFGLGLFPALGLEILHRRFRQVFAPEPPGAEYLKWEYLDGVTNFDIERLKTLGIFNIQQLARVEPGWLSLCTHYPLARVVDWIDQALLITYLREDILSARQFGIRSATDLRMLYREATRSDLPDLNKLDESERSRRRAGQAFKDIANMKRGKLFQEELLSIGSSLNDDVLVDLLDCFHNRRC
ncbi:hypothetical protein DAT35_13390 [Vitiosangium sp. GDMCC 1.1324]|nr:hypothetical protein DAT35_13390 [Vitiosangium sp. GDMCC 1.1324]